MCTQKDFEKLQLDDEHREFVRQELDLWHRTYLPAGEVELDVGAGCGETVCFFLNHGSKHVIAIEADPSAYQLLLQNYGNDPRVTCIQAKIGHVKIDIDGAEKNMILETHFPVRFKKLQRIAHSEMILWRVEQHGIQWRLWAFHMRTRFLDPLLRKIKTPPKKTEIEKVSS